MKRFLLACMAILTLAVVARADYLVIIYNLNAKPVPEGGGPMGEGPGGPGAPMPVPGGPGFPGPGGPGRPGGPGGTMPGPGEPMGPGMEGGNFDALDDSPALIVAVLEARASTPTALNSFKAGQPGVFRHFYGPDPRFPGQILLVKKDNDYEVLHFAKRTTADRFKQEKSKVYDRREKPTAKALLELAEKALEFGLMNDFAETMSKVGEADPNDPKFLAYQKVKAVLDKPAGRTEMGPWQKKLLDGYKLAEPEGSRFALLHLRDSDNAPEVTQAIKRLDNSLKGYYYWWALQGVALAVPEKRLVSVLAASEDFKRIKGEVVSGPVISDSFHAPRQGLTVFSPERGDAQFVELKRATAGLITSGYNLDRILSMKGNEGVPRGTDAKTRDVHIARTKALLRKVLEDEWLRNATTHKVARELVFASGLLPRNVRAPEWLLFGMGSLFEIPLQAPHASFGKPNSYYLPRFKEYLKAGKYGDMEGNKENAQMAVLMSVLTGAPIRSKPPAKGAKAPDKETEETVLRHRRAAYWSLVHYLSKNNLKGLQAFCAELGKQPRDIELDGEVILHCFAKAFDCWDTAKDQPDMLKLKLLADRWISYSSRLSMEGEEMHKEIREAFARINKPAKEGGTGTPGTTPGTTPGGPGRP